MQCPCVACIMCYVWDLRTEGRGVHRPWPTGRTAPPPDALVTGPEAPLPPPTRTPRSLRDVVKQQKHQHFERMMKLIFAVLRRAAAVPSDGPEAGPGLIGGCQAYARLVSTIDPAVGFFAAEHYEASCAETHRLTLHVMQQLAQDPANHCLVEALDAMLEVWVTLITDKVCQVYAHQFHRATNACVDERRVQCLLKSSADLVQQFVQFKLTCHSLGYRLLQGPLRCPAAWETALSCGTPPPLSAMPRPQAPVYKALSWGGGRGGSVSARR